MNDNGRFILDNSVDEPTRNEIAEKVKGYIDEVKPDVDERTPVIQKRQDFYEGRHHKWTNVIGQVVKEQEGHILAVFNYVLKFSQKLQQTLTNLPPKIKIVPKDEANEIETSRTERVEEIIGDILKENKFFSVIFDRASVNQIRDGDFVLDCRVIKQSGVPKIVISTNEDLLKLHVGWDDASGSTFSFVAFEDMWTLTKIKRQFGYDAEAYAKDLSKAGTQSAGDHLKNQYGLFASGGGEKNGTPSGANKLPKAKITDYWGWEVIGDQAKVINIIFINDEMKQFVVTDYKEIPKLIGHSLSVAGKPWSQSFIDPLMEPQIELNDRTGEEGDLIRIGSHMKFLAINMSDFDPDAVKPGSGQVIFISGEGADFRPLQMTISPFPSSDYINRIMEHLFTLGIPKIALAAGTAPYTGKVGAIQYQPFSDLVTKYRGKWEDVLEDLITRIQEYIIDYFPELKPIMRESIMDEQGNYQDGDVVVRGVEFDWENPLPLSRSDKVVDAATLRDRGLISVSTTLEQAGFRDPQTEIKKLKKESKDEELMTLLPRLQQFAPGAVKAQIDARREMTKAEESNAATMGAMTEAAKAAATPASPAPILHNNQNEGGRGVLSGAGTPAGQTATPKGAAAQVVQNQSAQLGG